MSSSCRYQLWLNTIFFCLSVGIGIELKAQEVNEMFDDFNYSSPDDPNLMQINSWSIVDGPSGPPEGGIYASENIRFINDTVLAFNKLMVISTFVDKAENKITHARIETSVMPYWYGTFAARVYFDDTPAIYSDGNVETFYTISNYSTCEQADLYSECDFEYLPYDSWSPTHENTLYYTTWETCLLNKSNGTKESFEGWHNLMYTCSETGSVRYYVDGELKANHNQYTPDADVNISFANWILGNNTGTSTDTRTTSLLADWIYHAQNTELSTDEVITKVDELRSAGIVRKNLDGNFDIVSLTETLEQKDKFPKINIFPNPSSGSFYITNTAENDELLQVNIITTNGSLLESIAYFNYSNKTYSFTISNQIPTGLCGCFVKTRQAVYFQKLVVIR